MNKLKLLPIIATTATAVTPFAITSCGSNSTSLSYTGAVRDFYTSTHVGAENLYFKINTASRDIREASNVTISFKILNCDSLGTTFEFSDVVWDNYANGEFHTTLTWTWSSTILAANTANFDVKVKYLDKKELSNCIEEIFTGFSTTINFN